MNRVIEQNCREIAKKEGVIINKTEKVTWDTYETICIGFSNESTVSDYGLHNFSETAGQKPDKRVAGKCGVEIANVSNCLF